MSEKRRHEPDLEENDADPPPRSHRIRNLARAMSFPRGELAEAWQACLQRALAPHLARLEAEIHAVRSLLELVSPALDHPCHVVGERAGEGDGIPELARFVPGDAVEHPDLPGSDAMVFTYRHDSTHGICHPDALQDLEQGLAVLKVNLLHPDPQFESRVVTLLEALPDAELEILEARQGEWNEPLAEREAWMRRTMEALQAFAEDA